MEWEKERLLMLEGKIQITKEHLKDPILKFHHDFKKVEVKAKKSQERKLSQIKAKRKISQNSRIKVKWSNAMDKLKVKNFMDLNNVNKIGSSSDNPDDDRPDQNCKFPDDVEETIVANLVYDESQDQLTLPTSLLDSAEEETDVKKIEHPNPVFQAFDDAKNVDDLYRIAEIWVNPTVYYQLDD